ncbi:hypothetical protein T4B_2057 [Trichinella pseudospiralis]|uniref:Uncharacterized protein n=1 Tax=Trichinella pseudospiralis TaxID=6337 RepID=A0A0V1H505_TRIPS|nr:hypothetical protein T4A_4858 [Trichinella pseudospiralis]KRZ05381.1 hypothetical protein T4B_2057 [Trichinella pseudospiralis]KRZ39369.1 hypothetical protein T4C_7799 [Trichinella pseudospiralis]
MSTEYKPKAMQQLQMFMMERFSKKDHLECKLKRIKSGINEHCKMANVRNVPGVYSLSFHPGVERLCILRPNRVGEHFKFPCLHGGEIRAFYEIVKPKEISQFRRFSRERGLLILFYKMFLLRVATCLPCPLAALSPATSSLPQNQSGSFLRATNPAMTRKSDVLSSAPYSVIVPRMHIFTTDSLLYAFWTSKWSTINLTLSITVLSSELPYIGILPYHIQLIKIELPTTQICYYDDVF